MLIFSLIGNKRWVELILSLRHRPIQGPPASRLLPTRKFLIKTLRYVCLCEYCRSWRNENKCIGDDRKATARQSPNYIKNTKINKIRRKTIFNMADGILSPCNVARGSGMACHWIPQNVRHIGILLLVSILTISPQSTCHSAPVCEILSKSDCLLHKNDVMSIFKMADLRYLEF